MLAGLASLLLISIIRQLGGLQPWEQKAYDQGLRLRLDQGLDSRLLVVEITEEDIQTEGRWPLSDQTLATVLENLQQHQPNVIGLDIYRDLPQPPGTEQLSTQLKRENIVAITNLADPPIPPPPSVPPEQVGFNDVVLDSDSVVRRQLMFVSDDSGVFFAFSLKLALYYLQKQGIKPENLPQDPDAVKLGQAIFRPLSPNAGGYHQIDNGGYQILLNYRGRQAAPSLSINQVLEEKFDPALVRDRVVLIGASADSIKDNFLTPYSPLETKYVLMPGVMLHAQMVSHLLSSATQDFSAAAPKGSPLFSSILPLEIPGFARFSPAPQPFRFWFEGVEYLWIGLWVMGGSILIWRSPYLVRQGLVLLVSLIVLVGSFYGLLLLNVWVPIVAPVLGVSLTGIGLIAYKQVYYASYDPLTNLPNRRVFLNKLEQAISQATSQNKLCGVLFLNIDRFKMVNESWDHSVGDQLLVQFVERLRQNLRANDVVARLNGDEFAVLISNFSQVQNAIGVTERILQSLVKPFHLTPPRERNTQEIIRTASIGIAVGESADERAEELLGNASIAMRRARRQGIGRYQLYAADMIPDSRIRLQLETDLRLALQRQEFVLHYQPLFSLAAQTVIGLEALVRWQRPSYGLVTPDQFISVAKETGLIVPIGQWAIATACQQLKLWQSQFSLESPLVMAVNVSSRQFTQTNFAEQIKAIIQASDIDASCLRLEITESTVMEDVPATIHCLSELEQLGVKLSIDDFGTGFSSLSSLSRFPIHALKIDQTFIHQMEPNGNTEDNLELIQAIIDLAHALKLEVVAEGVETKSQLEQLTALGCEIAQGYYFLKPVPVKQATDFLIAQATRSF